ncbi:MAG: hypothetical protein V4469_00530 [Patescibacteria group bacterium]
MKILYSILWILEGLNILVWLFMGVVAVLFMDSPDAKFSDLWYIPTIIIALIIIEAGTVFIVAHYNASWVKYAVIAGFILSMIGSFPSFLKIGNFIDRKDTLNNGSLIVKNHLENNTPLDSKEMRNYFDFLKQDDSTEENIANFNKLLDKDLIKETPDFTEDTIFNEVLSLKPLFTATYLKHNPVITNNSSLVFALYFKIDTSPEASKENIEKLKMLLAYGLNPTIKDWAFSKTSQKSSIEAMEYQISLLEKATEKDVAQKQEYAKEKGKDPSQIEDDDSLKKEKADLKYAQDILSVLKGN